MSDGSDKSDGEVHPCWGATPLYFTRGDPAMDPDRGASLADPRGCAVLSDESDGSDDAMVT